MNTLATFAVLLLAGLVCSNPVTTDILTIDKDFFPDELSFYTAEHEIVKIYVPLNSLNFDADTDIDISDNVLYVFFVEAEKTADGKFDYKGLYYIKDKVATKVLDTGRDVASTSDDSKVVYFAGADGLYFFDEKTKKAEKYGTLTDDIIGLEKANGTGGFYILTADYKVFKVNEEGTEKEEVTKVKDARQIVLDYAGNLFYVDSTYNVYVYSGGEVTKVKGLPHSTDYVKLLRAPFLMEEGVPVIAGRKAFSAYVNGTSEFSEIVFDTKPTAYSMEAALIQYYAFNKKIYEYNILAIVMGAIELEELKTFFSEKTDEIQTIASRSRMTYHKTTPVH